MSTPPASRPLTLDEIAFAVSAGMGTVAPGRKTGAIAMRTVALLVRHQARGFKMSQACAAEKLGVTPGALSRAGDRAEEALAYYRRNIATDKVTSGA